MKNLILLPAVALTVVAGWYSMPLALGVSLAFAGAAVVAHRRADVLVVTSALFFLIVLIPEVSFVSPQISFFGWNVYVPHVLAAIVAPFAPWRRLSRLTIGLLVGYGLIVFVMAAWGIVQGAPLSGVAEDARGPVLFLGGVACSLTIVGRSGITTLLKLVPVVIGTTVVLIGMHLAFGARVLSGRVGTASGFSGASSPGELLNATRFILSSEDLAMACLLIVFWLSTQPAEFRPKKFALWGLAGASALIVVLSLSRQLLVGLGIGALSWVFIVAGFRRSFRMAAGSIPLVLGGVMILVVLTLGGVGLGSDSIVGRQADGFSARVIGGLTSDTLEADPGTAWRVRENELAIEVILDRPLGTGFGLPYRDEFEFESFGRPTFFRRWVHNVYLWYGTKGGVLGIVAVGLVTVIPLLHAVARVRTQPVASADPAAEAAVPILVALGVMSLVDQVIINSATGVITAAVLVLLGLQERPMWSDELTPEVDRTREVAGINAWDQTSGR